MCACKHGLTGSGPCACKHGNGTDWILAHVHVNVGMRLVRVYVNMGMGLVFMHVNMGMGLTGSGPMCM